MNKIKEKLTYYRTLLTLFWTSLFILGSGIAWSFINLKGTIMFPILPATGIIIELVLLLSIGFLDKRIKKLIKEL